jgi:tryptophanyl-tRNA synthetase
MALGRRAPDAETARSHLEVARDLAQRYSCALVEKRAKEPLSTVDQSAVVIAPMPTLVL